MNLFPIILVVFTLLLSDHPSSVVGLLCRCGMLGSDGLYNGERGAYDVVRSRLYRYVGLSGIKVGGSTGDHLERVQYEIMANYSKDPNLFACNIGYKPGYMFCNTSRTFLKPEHKDKYDPVCILVQWMRMDLGQNIYGYCGLHEQKMGVLMADMKIWDFDLPLFCKKSTCCTNQYLGGVTQVGCDPYAGMKISGKEGKTPLSFGAIILLAFSVEVLSIKFS